MAAGLVESFVTFGDTSSLYADLVGQRGKQWETRMAGCQGLAGAFGRAHAVLSFQPPPSPSIVATARAVIDLGTRGSAFVPRLCRCLEDSLAAAEITGDSFFHHHRLAKSRTTKHFRSAVMSQAHGMPDPAKMHST